MPGQCLSCTHWRRPEKPRSYLGHCSLDGELAYATYGCGDWLATLPATHFLLGVTDLDLALIGAALAGPVTQAALACSLLNDIEHLRRHQQDDATIARFRQNLRRFWEESARKTVTTT